MTIGTLIHRVGLSPAGARSSVRIECGVPDPDVMGSNPIALATNVVSENAWDLKQ